MKTRIVFASVLLGCAVVSNAQLMATGITVNVQFGTATELSFVDNSSIDMGASVITHSSMWSARADRADTLNLVNNFNWFAFKTGDFPVLMDTMVARVQGKLVVAGARGADDTTRTEWRHRWFEYEDANDNGLFDGGETSFILTSQLNAAILPNVTGERIDNFDESPLVHTSVLFAANTSFFLLSSFVVVADYAVASGDPNLVITHEYQSPAFNGVTYSFNAQPVPEPASLIALGLGAAALLRRSRRNAA